MEFSANIGFLWADLPLPERIRAAARAGFAAVEMHWPYDTLVAEVLEALDETGLPCLGLNTVRGDVEAGDFGLAALPGREAEARAAIDHAAEYAAAIGAGAIHVMAGKAEGAAARETFLSNLRYAAQRAPGKTLLIEPINQHDAPGYFLRDQAFAAGIIEELGLAQVKLMFDCYHCGRTEGVDVVLSTLDAVARHVGHIQIAAVPDRGAPDHGALDYTDVFAHIRAMGWGMPIGAEYKPTGATDDTLSWMASA
ncbi:hydroxypyruvate isomerase family protein [Roseobacteraceae bacterium S113]